MLFHPPRMLRAVRRRALRRPRAASPLSVVRHAAAAPATTWRAARAWSRDSLAGRGADDVALSRAAAALRRRDAGHARRGLHAAAAHAPRSATRSASSGSTSRTSRSTRPTRSRRADSRRPSPAPRALGATTLSVPIGRQRRQRRWPPTPPRAGLAARGLHAARRQDAVHPRVRAVRRRRHAGRRPHHRRRPAVAASSARTARLVRRLDAEGAVPRRGQEDDGLRAGRAARLDAARLDHLSDRRRHRHGRHVEGLRRDRGARLDRPRRGRGWSPCRPTGCAPIVRAFERGHRAGGDVGSARHRGATACACRKAIGDFLVLRAIRESGGTALAVTDRRDGRRHDARSAGSRASARRPKAARRCRPLAQLVAAGAIQPHETVVLFNTGGALKYLDVLHARR